MDILIDNSLWMIWNIFLALAAVFFGYVALRISSSFSKFAFGFFWLLFTPNSIYILTDVIHFQKQWFELGFIEKYILTVEYLTLEAVGILAFLICIRQFETILHQVRIIEREYYSLVIVATNFIIAFGVVIGRIQRTNSWEVFTNPARVYYDGIKTLTSLELMLLVLIFGIAGNAMYFLGRPLLIKNSGRIKKLLGSPIILQPPSPAYNAPEERIKYK